MTDNRRVERWFSLLCGTPPIVIACLLSIVFVCGCSGAADLSNTNVTAANIRRVNPGMSEAEVDLIRIGGQVD